MRWVSKTLRSERHEKWRSSGVNEFASEDHAGKAGLDFAVLSNVDWVLSLDEWGFLVSSFVKKLVLLLHCSLIKLSYTHGAWNKDSRWWAKYSYNVCLLVKSHQWEIIFFHCMEVLQNFILLRSKWVCSWLNNLRTDSRNLDNFSFLIHLKE